MEEHEWELSKENVQPLRQGRTMSSLSKGLHADPKDEAVIRENQRAFELELRTYDGDDPLDVWYRYIKWTEQHFPKGRHDGQLPKLIEKCLKKFQSEGQYANDSRFINLWIEYSNFTDSPTEVFSYMFDNAIGTKVSQLYVEWATVLEIAGNTKKADSIYTEGLNRMAEPKDLLLQKQEQFQHRLAKNITLQIADKSKSEVKEDHVEKREVLTRLKPVGGGHRVGTTRTGAVTIGSAGRLKDQRGSVAPKQVPSQGFTVFNDENVKPQKPAQTNEWVSMPTKSVDSKENDRQPGVWTGAKLRQGRVASETPSSAKEVFKIHEDPVGKEAVTPMKTTIMAHKPLSAVKAPPQQNVLVGLRQGQSVPVIEIPMYPKDRIYNGVQEFSLEELRAIQYWKRVEEEERLRKEATMKAQLEAQEERLKVLESLQVMLQSQFNNLNLQKQQQQSVSVDGLGDVQPMESESESVSLQTSLSATSSFERKSVSAKQDMFVKKMEEAASASAAVPKSVNESTDFITPTNLSGAFPSKPPSSARSQSSGGSSISQRTPIFNSLSTYSSLGSSAGGGPSSLKGYGRYNNSGRLLDTSSSLNQSSTKSTPAKLADEGNTSVCGGLTRNKVAITAPSPTVCTKEAFQLVQGMFCAELDPDSIMEGVETADLGNAPSSIPFQICEDKTEHDLPAQRDRKEHLPVIYQDENNVQPLQIYQDENDMQQPMCQDANHMQPNRMPTASNNFIYQDENDIQQSKVPFEFFQDENIPLGTSNRPLSSKKEGKKFGARLSFAAMEDVEMTDTDKGHLQDFTVAHAQEDVTIASLSTFSIKACAASTPFHGRPDSMMPNASESVECEVTLPSCANTTSQLMEDNSEMPSRHLSPILEGSGEGSSSSNNHTKSQVHSSLEPGVENIKNTAQQSIAIKSVIHEDSDEGLADETHCDNQLLDATCHHIIDTSACLPNEETEALLAASVSMHTKDPYDPEGISLYLSRLQPPLSAYKNYHEMSEDVQMISQNDVLSVVDDEMIAVDKRLGEGGYAQVYKMNIQSFENFDNQDFQAMKVQKPPCHWEFYVSCEIQKRVTALKAPMDVRPSIMSIDCGYFNNTLSILVMKLLEHGSLLDLVNLYKSDPKLMGQVEPFVCLATVELLHLFEQLHKCDIIHGDVKPDNFLLMDLPVVCDGRSPREVFGSQLRLFCLTDFGQTIDMHMFPTATSFRTKTNTDGFECIEMRTDRPWTYQTDLFGLAGTIHVLLFGSYMKVFVEKGVWKITGNFVRKWNVPIWKKLFDQLLNIQSCDNLPDLASLRAEFEEYFCSNLTSPYNEWARKVRVLLNRETRI